MKKRLIHTIITEAATKKSFLCARNGLISALALIIFLILPVFASSQQPMNPSFEGEPGWSISPPEWMPCKSNSTPDTQPESDMNMTKPASDGNTYLGMVTRGIYGDNRNTTEAIGTWLTGPLELNGCYTFVVDLHLSRELGHVADWAAWQSYNVPVKLKVWGGTGQCQYTELLFESGPIWDADWTTYSFPFHPKRNDLNFIILELDWIESYTYFGNLMIDNIRIEKTDYDFDLGRDTTLCESDEIILEVDAENGLAVVWQDGSTGKTFKVTQPGTYWAETGEGDCKSSDTITIDYMECVRCNFWMQTIFVPSSETPILYPNVDCEVDNFHMQIFNTMGQLVFETKDVHSGWDGKAGQLTVKTGIYIYRATFQAEDWGTYGNKLEWGKILVVNKYH